jgi:hypothetical protein
MFKHFLFWFVIYSGLLCIFIVLADIGKAIAAGLDSTAVFVTVSGIAGLSLLAAASARITTLSGNRLSSKLEKDVN